MRKFHFALLILLLATWSINAAAQATASGTIQGTVTDTSGAVVVGADVQAIQKSTGTVRTGKTNGSGEYRFELLPASLYEIRATKTGFGTVVQRAELLVGTTATLNASLKPGAAGEVVEGPLV